MGIRTPDLLHAMQALYQLSYSPWMHRTTAPSSVAGATPVYKKLEHIRRVAVGRRASELLTIERQRATNGLCQSSAPSSATSTGSGSAPTLNSSSRQRPPPTRRDSSDQQQFPIPPVTRSSSPSRRDIPQVREAP